MSYFNRNLGDFKSGFFSSGSNNPWDNPAVDLWLDYESDTTKEMPGFRYNQASSQEHTSPHISQLDGATAATFEFWSLHEGYSVAGNEMGYFGQGAVAPGTYSNGNGFYLSTYNSDNTGLNMIFVPSTGVYKRVGHNPSTGTRTSSHIFVYDGLSTPKIWLDGVSKTLTINDALPMAMLPTGSATFRVGAGYRRGQFVWFMLRIWNRALSDTEIATLVENRKAPLLYSELEAARTGLSTNILRNWEAADVICKATGTLLTPVNSPTTETVMYERKDRANGHVFTNLIGNGQHLATNIFKTGKRCGHNESHNISGTGHSSAALITTASSSATYTGSTGALITQIYPLVSVAASENFNGYNIWDVNQTNNYQGPGYMTNNAKANIREFAYRLRSTSPSLNGNWFADLTPALNTAYTVRWHWTGSTMSCNINNVDRTVSPNFGGASYFPQQQSVQNRAGTSLFGGSGWKCYDGVTVKFNTTPSAALLASINSIINN